MTTDNKPAAISAAAVACLIKPNSTIRYNFSMLLLILPAVERLGMERHRSP
jgi:hypothetical protein